MDTTGYVYFIGNKEEGYVKIGMTGPDNGADSRISSLQTGCPFELELIAHIRCDGIDARIVERDFHCLFSHCKTKGEWFRYTNFVRFFLESMPDWAVAKAASSRGKAKAWNMAGMPKASIKALREHAKSNPTLSAVLFLQDVIQDQEDYIKELELKVEAADDLMDKMHTSLDELVAAKINGERMGVSNDDHRKD